MRIISAVLLLLITFLAGPVVGQTFQEKECGTVALEELKQKRFPGRNLILEFEKQLQQKQNERLEQFGKIRPMASQQEVYRIPVVVHVLHRGEPYGEGANIPDEQIFEQIRILNEDFRRLNADTINTPALFKPSAADVGIEFVLAKTDPQGLPTTGIVRKQGTRNTWGIPQMVEISNNSYWPAEDYINIWVGNLTFGIIGWAQFPDFTELPGVVDTNLGGGARTDGVVIDYELFGMGGSARADSRGRTLTHELGHFLGLRHTWGDGDCSVDDYCLDTPLMDSPSNGCPPGRQSCGVETMIQNYMDYSSDVCMNIFTLDQKGRMLTVLENAVRRKNLVNSPGLNDPGLPLIDLSVGMISADAAVCDEVFSAQVQIRNTGNTLISQAELVAKAGGNVLGRAELSGALQAGALQELSFSSLILPNLGLNELIFEITAVNGLTADGEIRNNARTFQVLQAPKENPPITQNFEQDFSSWSILNPDRLFEWTQDLAPSANPDNQALALRFFEFGEANIGTRDLLLSPLMDFSNAEAPELLFRHAYSYRSGTFYKDTLRILYSTDCGKTFPSNQVLWEASGTDLASTPVELSNFRPSGPGDWSNSAIDLSELKGLSQVIIAFEGVNGRGNNLYLDDIGIYPDQTPRVDLSLSLTDELLPVYCPGDQTFTLSIQNRGVNRANGFIINYQVGNQTGVFTYTETALEPSQELSLDVQLPLQGLGPIQVVFNVLPLNAVELSPDDNVLEGISAIANNTRPVPFRERFESGLPSENLFYSLGATVQPGIVSVPRQNNAVQIPFEGTAPGIHRWVLPSFDLSSLQEASFHFKLAYGRTEDQADRIRIWALSSCGNLVKEVYSLSLADSAEVVPSGWQPQTPSDWLNIYIPLSEFSGLPDVRLVIEMESSGQGDLFFDDFEFYTQDIANPVNIPENSIFTYPNPNFGELNIVFSNTSLKDITIKFWDIRGIPVHEQRFPDTFNQNYRIDMSLLRPGVYIMEITGPEIHYIQRVMRQ